MAFIEARGLRKVFGTTVALDSVDLSVEEGRIVGLSGPNGAGKTTALNAILGAYSAASRTVLWTTPPVEEMEAVLAGAAFRSRGRIVFSCSREQFDSRYPAVMVSPKRVAAARALQPIPERQLFGRGILLF